MNNFNKILLRYKLSENTETAITIATCIATTPYYFKKCRIGYSIKSTEDRIYQMAIDLMAFCISSLGGLGTGIGVVCATKFIGKIGLTTAFAGSLLTYNYGRSDRPKKNDE